ncbi:MULTISPECIES: DUF3285 domain-containing protein [Spirulina sp. CCY15215]|uniref:DUF3285 domain-containing protein n=1 Tax=Spirulina sp. CCY15215 TaxID=2767591 RepID=UPI00194E21D4|nr:DUF3285 domain-containing protein [Spirulina major]
MAHSTPASDSASTPPISEGQNPVNETTSEPPIPEEQASYVKLAMRNMVRKRGKSLFHFFLSTLAVLGLLIGVSYLTR